MKQSDRLHSQVSEPFLPPVSVVIPIYNGAEDLPVLLTSIRSQTYPCDRVEYLLVDNASQDATAAIICDAVEDLKPHGITVGYFNENNIQSSYAARNLGIRKSSGDIIAFTDADCRLKQDWLFNLIQPFSDPAIGLVGGGIFSLKGESLIERFSEYWGLLDHKGKLSLRYYPYAQTANLAVRRHAFEVVGLFRPFLTTGGDADLCWRIQQQTDWKFHCQENAVIEHHHRSSLQGLIRQFKRYGHSEKYLFELYGVDLDPARLTWTDYLYQWGKWQFKGAPLNALKILLGRATLLDLCIDPLKLIAKQSKAIGRNNAQLSDDMRKIAWLQNSDTYQVGYSNLVAKG